MGTVWFDYPDTILSLDPNDLSQLYGIALVEEDVLKHVFQFISYPFRITATSGPVNGMLSDVIFIPTYLHTYGTVKNIFL